MTEKPRTLETKDLELLRQLQTDARLSNAELAEQLGVSASACYRRVKALETDGIIKEQVALLDPVKLGLAFHAIVHVSLSRHNRSDVDAFIAKVCERPEVVECFSTTGDADFHLRVLTADTGGYNAFLDEFLFGLPGVSQVRTNLVLREIKQTTALPI